MGSERNHPGLSALWSIQTETKTLDFQIPIPVFQKATGTGNFLEALKPTIEFRSPAPHLALSTNIQGTGRDKTHEP
jgi:hypothetical protein